MAAIGPPHQVAGRQIESAETPSKPDDYVVVNGYRLVSRALHIMLATSGHRCRPTALSPKHAPMLPPPHTGAQVKPYYFDFCCSVRQRWLGQNIIDIFTRVGPQSCRTGRQRGPRHPLAFHMMTSSLNAQEFPARDRQYYMNALADGRLRVEGCQVGSQPVCAVLHSMMI